MKEKLKCQELPDSWIKVLCEQTREFTDDLHDFLDYV